MTDEETAARWKNAGWRVNLRCTNTTPYAPICQASLAQRTKSSSPWHGK